MTKLAKALKKIPMRLRIKYLERDIKRLNSNLAQAKKGIEMHESTAERMRLVWLEEKERSEFLYKSLQEEQMIVRNLQLRLTADETLSKGTLKRAVKSSMLEILQAQPKVTLGKSPIRKSHKSLKASR